MAYEIVKTGDKAYEVRKGREVHMRVRGPFDGPPPKREARLEGVDREYAMRLAAWAIRVVRRQLWRGAFNNQMFIGGRYCYLTEDIPPSWLDYLAEKMALELAGIAGDTPKPRDTLTQMAARSLAARTVAGGVCSMIAYVTAGCLTTIAAPGTTIMPVFDGSFNHEYVVLYYDTSPYVVADPWVGRPAVCSWNDCLFKQGCVTSHTLMQIGQPLDVAYGVRDEDIPGAGEEIHETLTNIDKVPKGQRFEMFDAYGQESNLVDSPKETYQIVVEPADWGPRVTVPPPPRISEPHRAADAPPPSPRRVLAAPISYARDAPLATATRPATEPKPPPKPR